MLIDVFSLCPLQAAPLCPLTIVTSPPLRLHPRQVSEQFWHSDGARTFPNPPRIVHKQHWWNILISLLSQPAPLLALTTPSTLQASSVASCWSWACRPWSSSSTSSASPRNATTTPFEAAALLLSQSPPTRTLQRRLPTRHALTTMDSSSVFNQVFYIFDVCATCGLGLH